MRVRENPHTNAVACHGSNKCADYSHYPEGSKVHLPVLKELLAVLLEELGHIRGIKGIAGGLIRRSDKEPGQYRG